jgi:hypothetical protein
VDPDAEAATAGRGRRAWASRTPLAVRRLRAGTFGGYAASVPAMRSFRRSASPHRASENLDGGVPHGLTLSQGTSGVPPRTLAEADIIVGPDRRTFRFPTLQPGPYLFTCRVHPNMLVEVVVQ